MQRNTHPSFLENRPHQRIAALTGFVLAGLTLLSGAVHAATTGPLPTSPQQPTPYITPTQHGGGASTPYPLTSVGTDPLLDPLYGQLQGTASGVVPATTAGALTQIPSFLLGNYNPLLPPTTAGTYYPNHFADGNIFSWSAPFTYVPQNVGGFTVDDTQTTPIAAGTLGAGSVFATPVGTWNAITTGNEAGTATGGEYLRLIFGQLGSATWTLKASTPGNYSVYFHIPDNIDDGAGNVETRNSNVTYLITVATAAGVVVTNGASTVSQTDANSSQFLAGPFQLLTGDTVTVTLERTATVNNLSDGGTPVKFGQYDLIADSMSLQAAIGDVQSTPTAINATAYPNEFKNVVYWGIDATTSSLPTIANPTAANYLNLTNGDAVPDTGGTGTTPVLRYGVGSAGGPDSIHAIRQLVYFGRSEPIFSNQANVDDSFSAANGFTPGDFTTAVASGTATNGEYRRAAATSAGGVPAQWALRAPNGGNYFVTVHLPGPTLLPPPAETRALVFYKLFIGATQFGPVIGYPINQATQGGDVLLPTGPIPLQRNQVLTVSLSTATTDPLVVPVQSVVADSVRMNTGTGTGAIYCVDGFTGGVVWRFETPGSANGPSAPVYSSPAIVRINVLVNPATNTYANKLVVIVGDNNGLVYCLDAIGNGDGTSNAAAIDPNTGQPIYIPQPAYGTVVPAITPATANANPHVGTTGIYWIYRPDASRPKNIATGTPRVDTSGNPILFPSNDLPVPAAFGTASPTVFVDPTINTAVPAASNATVYVGNSNGVLYALDAGGVGIDGTSATTFADTGDIFNVSQDLRVVPNVFPAVAADPVVPTCQPKWWFSLRGASPNAPTNTSAADIESAPALYIDTTTTLGSYLPHVYFGSAHEAESTSNIGRLYALDGLLGPSGNNGRSDPAAQKNPAAAGYTGPGSANYNIGQKPQTNNTDTLDWTFPDVLDTATGTTATNPTFGFKGQSSNGKPRPALGNITGSPVVFTNLNHETVLARQTRLYFAANVGVEIPAGSATGVAASVRPDETQTGRLWAVNLDGSVGTTTNSGAVLANNSNVWAYPLANDPNNAAKDTVAEPLGPIGSFLHSTPAVGFVQFPKIITTGDGTAYNPTDVVNIGGIKGNSIPMLYIGTRGVNDTALYAIDIDGTMVPGPVTATVPATPPDIATDTRTIYRQISPDGSLFQSSPVLITNATSVAPSPAAGGNGGSVLITAGNTLYDFSATPISNPITTQAYPLIREDRAYTGFGPISGPALAAADVTDLSTAFLTNPLQDTSGYTQNATDWVYVGDSNTGYCRGITPNDVTYAGIPPQLGSIVPPDANQPGTVSLTSIIQTYLVSDTNAGNRDARPVAKGGAALVPGPAADLPVYEWGQNVYIRFKNVVPPDTTGNKALSVHDNVAALSTATAANPITVYDNGGPIEFDLSDVDDSSDSTGNSSNSRPITDHGTVPASTPAPPAATSTPLPNGFYPRTDTITANVPPALADPTSNLVDSTGKGYIGAYTYAISDGTVRRNTPGGRRQVVNAHQTVMAYITKDGGASFGPGTPTTIVLSATATNGNVTSVLDPATGKYKSGFNVVAPVDQPTFGILNPLGVRAGGIPLLPAASNQPPPTAAVQIGNELGPFRSVPPTIAGTTSNATTTTPNDLEALTNGNSVYVGHAPPSTSGLGNPTKLIPLGSTGSIIPPTTIDTVVTSTPLIGHNHSGDNDDFTNLTAVPTGNVSATAPDGLLVPNFGYAGAPYAANVFDRTPLGLQSDGYRTVSAKMDSPPNDNTSGKGGLYWNDNNKGLATNDHNAVVNYLPWESAPGSYGIGTNTSPDYPDIGPQNIAITLHVGNATTDLQASSGTLKQATGLNVTNRTVIASSLQVHLTVPNHQPANQQIYIGNLTNYDTGGERPPLTNGVNNLFYSGTAPTFPMGYVTIRRIYVPTRGGRYQVGAAFREIGFYSGVPVDMSTSITNPTTDIGKVPAAFGLQTEQYPGLSLFTPNNPAFQDYFKPLEIHNDGNVNLLNIHLDQKIVDNSGNPISLLMHSDGVDPLSAISGYDLPATGSTFGVTGPRSGTFGTAPEEPYLIRSSLDTDLVRTYGRNPIIPLIEYPGATFHKPLPGSDAPSVLTVPDSPESAGAFGYISPSPTGLPQNGYTAPPMVSIAMPFGTPVGTYSTSAPQEITSLRLFDGLDTAAQYGYSLGTVNNPKPINYLYPPQYGKATGGIDNPDVQGTIAGQPPTGEPLDSSGNSTGTGPPGTGIPEDIYNGAQPISTTGTQLTATVVEQRLTDGNTYGDVPMIDAGPAGLNNANAAINAPDFGPAAFRDPTTGNLSAYWTSGRSTAGYNLFGVNLPFTQDPTNNAPGQGYFLPSNPPAATPTVSWWTSIGGYNAAKLLPVPNLITPGTNSGLTVALDSTGTNKVTAFAVNVDQTNGYNNTLYSYTVTPKTGALDNPLKITNDPSQVKYGVKGLSTGTTFTNNLWAFWTASTRGRTAIYYNSQNNGTWLPTSPTIGLLPIPAGLTSVADPSPILINAPVNGALTQTVQVTYSGTGPNGNVDLYTSRYVPDATTASKLNLVAYPSITEILTPVTNSGWYQARDVAWSRTGALNVSVTDSAATALPTQLLYDTANKPLFTRAIFDKASGLLVLTGINGSQTDSLGKLVFNNVPANGTITVYVDAATGRVRFTGGTPARQVTALFNPLAKRLTTDARADTAPVTFLDDAFKPNDDINVTGVLAANALNVRADRLWAIWRKSGIGGDTASATLYYKTQRLTAFLPTQVDVTQGITITLGATGYTGAYDVHNIPSTKDRPLGSARVYFPTASGAEGQNYSIVYFDTAGTKHTWPANNTTDAVQWQDERRANDEAVPILNSIDGLAAVNSGYGVPIDIAVNENNVAAFIDPFASATSEHKVWLFWNSTRNGTADIYSAAINPLF